MKEQDRWNDFTPEGGWLGHDKSRDAQRWRYVQKRTQQLSERDDGPAFLELLGVCLAYRWWPRYRTRVFLAFAIAAMGRDQTLAEAAWQQVLRAIEQDGETYDFLSCISEICEPAFAHNLMTSTLAANLLRLVKRGAATSPYGWEDIHLGNARKVMPRLEGVAKATSQD